jgi:polyferredoxin
MGMTTDRAIAAGATDKTTKRRTPRRTIHWLRLGVQIVVAVFVLLLSIGQTLAWSWSANLHTICPFGGVANLYTYFSTGGYVAKLHSAVFVMLLALVIGLVLTGKSFCGWICPLGTVQELLGKAGRRLWPRLYNRVPHRVERVLFYGKYVMLIWIIVQTARSARLFFESFDPYYNLFTIWSDEVAWIGYVVIAATVVAALFIERPFSRYACPLGAVNGFFNSFSLVQIKRDAASCTDCGRCDKACPVKIDVSHAAAVRSIECTRCLECVEACPVNARTGNTLKLKTIVPWTRIGRKPLPTRVFAMIAILAFAAPIAVTIATGDFVVTSTHIYSSPADIKGSSPLDDLVENFSVSKEALYNGIGIPSSVSAATQIKDLTAKMGLTEGEETVSPSTLRIIITYLDSPLSTFVTEGGADQAAVSAAAAAAGLTESSTVRELMELGAPGAVLLALTTTSAEAPAATESTVPASAEPAPTTLTSETTAASETGDGTAEIKGSTTLDQVRGMVSDFPDFLSEFGIDASEPGTAAMKDLKTTYGFELDSVRTYVADHQ